MLPERAASATPGKVHIDENVRNAIERKAMSLRYPSKKPGPLVYQNGTLPTRLEHFHASDIHLNGPIEHNERVAHIPPPTLLQNGTIEHHSSSNRRTEMSAIANQEEDRFTARGRPPPAEFYQNPRNKFKSLPIPPKQKKLEPNIAVRAYRWFKKALRNGKKKSPTPAESPQMENPREPSAHVRSKSLPRNARFHNKSVRREPINQQPPAPALVPSGTLPRVVQVQRPLEFAPPAQEAVNPTLRRAGSFHQSGDRRSLVFAEEDNGMNPLALGFPNLGNTCYWNSMLQALGACEPIATYYLTRESSRPRRNSDMNSQEEFTYYFGRLVNAMWSNSDGGEYIKRLRSIFHRENNNFGNTLQEDAHEFLVCLVNMLTRDSLGNECFSINFKCPKLTENIFGLDNGAFKKNIQGWIKNIMWCPLCQFEAPPVYSFTPFITLGFPGRYENVCNFIVLKKSTDQHRIIRYSVHVNASEGMNAARYLIAHETGISDNQMLIFQLNTSTFCQTVITEHDLIRNRQYRGADDMYVTQLEPVALKNGYEIVTVIFIHTEVNHETNSMDRLTHPFKCVLPLNASYHEIVTAIRDASGTVFRHPNQSLLFANDILVVDDSEYDHCVLNRVSKTPLLNERVARCLTEQTRIYPQLPRYLRLVVRWKRAQGIIFPQNDVVIRHQCYMEFNLRQPYTLSYLFSRYFAPEWLPDYSCERCKSRGAMRVSSYAMIPNVIVVSFKRFRHTNEGLYSQKIDSSVTFPLENFDVIPWIDPNITPERMRDPYFDVVSVACHAGTLENGHYYTYSRNPTNDIWRRYDDNHVQPVQSVDDCNAYVIVMQNHLDRMQRRKNMSQTVRENSSLFNSLRFRKSRDSLHRIPNGPPVAVDEIVPPRRESLAQMPNGGFNRNDISRSSRQTHL